MPQKLSLASPVARRAPSAPPRFGCTLRDGGLDAAWVRVTGELDLSTAAVLEQALRRADLRAPRVVLDLRALTFIDSSGVLVIAHASDRARRSGRRLVLVRGPTEVDCVLELTGASNVLEIVNLDPVEPPVQALVQLAQLKNLRRAMEPASNGAA